MHFDLAYREPAVLRDGIEVQLRLVRATDRELLRAGFSRWSPASRYLRFFAHKASLSEAELSYLTEVDQQTHIALGAETTVLGTTLGIGIARAIVVDAEAGVAEIAVAVDDNYAGRGLGSLLFARIVAAAGERGISRARCHVLAHNLGMVELIKAFSQEHVTQVEAGVASIEFALAPQTQGPAATLDKASPMARLLRLAAAGMIEGRDAAVRRWRELRSDEAEPIRITIADTADPNDGLD